MSPEEMLKQFDWAMSKLNKAFDTPAHHWLELVSKKMDTIEEKVSMSVKQLRCEASVSLGNDPTGENAIICGAPVLECAYCGCPTWCADHAQFCPTCGKPGCEDCENEHACPGHPRPSRGTTRADTQECKTA